MLKAADHRVLNFEHLSATRAVVQRGLESRVASALWAGYWNISQSDIFFAHPTGRTSFENDSKAIGIKTLFDIASVTKGLVGAVLTARFVERKWLNWDQKIEYFLPQFKNSDITIAHLLSHTAGFDAWAPLWKKVCEEAETENIWEVDTKIRKEIFLKQLFNQRPINKPGQICLYSDISFMLLLPILEQVGQASLEHLANEHVFKFIGSDSAHYRSVTDSPLKMRDLDVVATEKSEAWGGALLQGVVHDENCFALGGVSTHAGVFAHGLDLLQAGKVILSGLFSESTRKVMSSRVGRPENCSRTMGWDTPTPPESSAGELFSTQTIGHLGYTGTSLWIDFEAKLVVVLLTNRVHPTRNNDKIKSFRREFHNTLREELSRVSITQ